MERASTADDEDEMPHVSREHREQQAQEAPPGFVPPMSPADFAAVEALLGYEFGDKGLVEQALTHGSFYYPYRPGETYERLEYLGDGVLTCVMSREVFLKYRQLQPGPLTRLRAANVDKEKLARVAVEHGLHRFLRHKAPHLDGQIRPLRRQWSRSSPWSRSSSRSRRWTRRERSTTTSPTTRPIQLPRKIHDFIKELCKYPYHSNGLLDPPKVLSDIVESLIGAIYIDSIFNQEVVWQVFRNLADPLINLETLGKHPVSELFEFCQKTRRGVKIMKDEWEKNLTVEVLIDGELVGSATYAQKKEIALNRAAKAALDKLKETLGPSETESALGEVCEPLDKLDLAGTLEVQ